MLRLVGAATHLAHLGLSRGAQQHARALARIGACLPCASLQGVGPCLQRNVPKPLETDLHHSKPPGVTNSGCVTHTHTHTAGVTSIDDHVAIPLYQMERRGTLLHVSHVVRVGGMPNAQQP